ncbi:MAG: cobyrinate a,c-diamide synthase [Acidimicrobiales bacterium]
MIAGTHSGVGKTTVATGLMAALGNRGVDVAPAKVGPDFIDPGYHALATGRPGRNLDAWMCGADEVAGLAARAAAGADVLVVEGVMGLFDGAADGTPSSTAEVAKLIDAPVVLVVDASAMSSSVAAVVHGFATLDPAVPVAGVVLNRVASDGHESMLRQALEPLRIPVVGVLRRNDQFVWRDRHLGLVPVVEHSEVITESLGRLAADIDRGCDLEAILALARRAPERVVDGPALPDDVTGTRTVRIAVAGGAAFSFAYPDNLEALAAAGAEIVPFDPLSDGLPAEIDALIAGGGFPEVFAADLSANRALAADVGHRVRTGLVVWAECGGLLWLADRLDGAEMVGVVPTEAAMSDRLTLGYRTGRTLVETPFGPPGLDLRGHEFHYSGVSPAGDAIALAGRDGSGVGGFAGPKLLATYLHLHLGSRPDLAAAFVRTAARDLGSTTE